MTPQELGQRVKAKYPEYASIDDAELGSKVAVKYPQYKLDTPVQQNNGINFGQVANETVKAIMNPSPSQIGGSGLDIASRAVQAGLGNMYSQGREIAQNAVPQNIQENIGKGVSGALIPAPFNSLTKPLNKQIGNQAVGLGVDVGAGLASDQFHPMIENMLTPKANPNAVIKQYLSAIKPSVAGKGTRFQVEGYKNDVLSAVDSILGNKNNLGLEGTPKNLDEFSQSIDKTKKDLFSQYDALAKQSGQGGAKLSTAPVQAKLDEVINNKALGISAPEAVKYAKDLNARLASSGDLSPSEAQDLIANLNSGLKSFSRNPNMSDTSKAVVDAGVNSNLRNLVDNFIESQTGEHYAPLKKQYGSLKNIEGDVNKRLMSSLEGKGSGLMPLAQVFATGDIAQGLLSMNPGMMASGVAKEGVIQGFKHFNSPNRRIASMFNKAEENASLSGQKKATPLLNQLINKLAKNRGK